MYWLFKGLNLQFPKGTAYIHWSRPTVTHSRNWGSYSASAHCSPLHFWKHFHRLWFILSAFSNNHCSPPNPGYRRVLILVVSICKLRSRFLDHRSLCGSFLELNGSSKAAGSPTCLSAHWVGLPLGHGVERIFYFFSWVLRVLSPRYQSVVSLSTFVVCSWRSGMET